MRPFSFRACCIAALITLTGLLSSCKPSLSIQADAANGAALSFATAFSPASADTLRSLMSALGGSSDAALGPVVPATDLSALLTGTGFTDVKAKNPSVTEITAEAVYRSLSQGALPATGLIMRSKNSLTLTIGPAQLKRLYQLSSEEAQTYFDLLMIPALNDETMTVAEYSDLLASLYGKQFASDLTGGSLQLQLLSPDGKKKTEVNLPLGQVLTATSEKKWSVTW